MTDKDKLRFGIQNHRPKEFEQYVGKWIVVYPQGLPSFAGLCTKVEDGYAFLYPFQGGDIDPEKGLVKRIVEDDEDEVPVMAPLVGSLIEPQTRENIEKDCAYSNAQNGKSKDKKKKSKN